MKQKQIQISEELFNRIYAFFLLDHREPLQETIIRQELEAKMQRMAARDAYSASLDKKKTGRNDL